MDGLPHMFDDDPDNGLSPMSESDREKGRWVRSMRRGLLCDEKINPQGEERRKKVRELMETGLDVKDISLHLGMK